MLFSRGNQLLLAGFKQMTEAEWKPIFPTILSSHCFQELYSLAVEQMFIYYHSLSDCFLVSFSGGVYLQSKHPQLL